MKPSPAVAVYRGDAVTAAEICSVLGGSGVDARMQTTFGFRASGGRVMVPSSQAERALEVLKAYGFLHEADPSRPRALAPSSPRGTRPGSPRSSRSSSAWPSS